jgi:hypothetical protein
MTRLLVSCGFACALLVFAVTLSIEPVASAAANQRFVGTWRLVAYDGRLPAVGAHPTGLIYYDATGHMAAQLAPDRSRPSWPPNTMPTPEQAKDAIAGYIAYFGTYSVDENAQTVTHHREAALNNYAVDLVRKYEFDASGNRLALLPLERETAGARVTWERIR